jgi:hypothetical protein
LALIPNVRDISSWGNMMERRRKRKIICRNFTENKGRALREVQTLQVRDKIQLSILLSLSIQPSIYRQFCWKWSNQKSALSLSTKRRQQ